MKTRFKLLIILVFISFSATKSVHPQDNKYYDPVIDIVAKPGTERSFGSLNLMMPFKQMKDEFLFLDLRVVLDSHDNREGNVGIGYRKKIHLLKDNYILGGYGFFDRRRSEFNNHFKQITLGTELLGQKWRARFNYYEPLGDKEKIVSDAPDTATLLPSGFVEVNPNVTIEKSLRGLDLEFGTKVPVMTETWAHAGVYAFGLGDDIDLNGLRFRGHTDVTNWLRLGVESSYDNIRGSNHFAEIRFRMPFGNSTKRQTYKNTIHQYMMEPIVRDIDIVATNQTLRAALAQSGGKPERYYFVDNTAAAGGDGRPDTPFNTLAAAEAAVGKDNTIVVRLGDGTVTNMDGGITISDRDVRLLGVGIDLSTRDGVLVETATAPPHITNTGGDAVTIAAQGVEVAGFSIDNPLTDGIFVLNADDANIHDNTVTGAGNNGINLAYTDNKFYAATVTNNITNNNVLRGIYLRAFNGADLTSTITGNTANGNTQEGIRYEIGATNSTMDVTSNSNTTNINGGSAGLYAITVGNGDLTVNLNTHTANNNTANGAFFLTGGTGTHDITASGITANTNGKIGIGADVQDGVSTTLALSNTSATGNTSDGLNIISRSTSTLNAIVSGHTSAGNTQQGVDITADGTTTAMTIELDNIAISTSGSSGMFLRARSSGTLNATLANSTVDNNTSNGMFIEGASTANTSVQIDLTTISNSTSFNLQLSDNTSGTYNVDFGSGGLGSLGQNRVFGGGTFDVRGDLNGTAVSAQSNWWGVGTGLAPANLSLTSGGSFDSSNFLTTGPSP